MRKPPASGSTLNPNPSLHAMKIVRITAHASTCFNHPHEAYGNFKPGLSVEAEVHEGESVRAAIAELQLFASLLVEQEKARIIAKLNREHDERVLTNEIEWMQRRLNEKREAESDAMNRHHLAEESNNGHAAEATSTELDYIRKDIAATERELEHAQAKLAELAGESPTQS